MLNIAKQRRRKGEWERGLLECNVPFSLWKDQGGGWTEEVGGRSSLLIFAKEGTRRNERGREVERALPVSFGASPVIVTDLGDIRPPSVRGVNLRVEGAEGWGSGIRIQGLECRVEDPATWLD